MADDAESRLIAQAQTGDQRAFGGLVRRHQDRLYRFILRLTGNREEAMDLTQETFMKAHQALPGWRPEAQFRTWLFRIAHNAALDVLRRRERVGFSPLSDLDSGDDGHSLPDPGSQPDKLLSDRQSIELLERTLRELPVEHREILLLREVEDMSYAEIAATLGIAEGTVKSRIARARSAAIAGYQHHSGEKRDE